MEPSILVIIYSLFMNYASCSSVQVFQWTKLRGNYSLYHSRAELQNGIKCRRMAGLFAGRKLCIYFIINSILQVRFIKIGIKYIISGLKMERVLPKLGED